VKRIFAALALLALLAALCLPAAASAPVFMDANTLSHPAEIALLSDLGLVSGYADGSFRPDNCITRAEISKLICLLRTSALPASAAAPFPDAAASWAGTYIDYCADNGLVAGYADGTFRPGSYITIRELAKMLLVAVGWSDGKRYTGAGWAAAVDADAAAAGLYEGVPAERDRYVTRDNACLMIYNAMQCPAVDRLDADGGKVYVLDSMMTPVTFLEHRFGLSLASGTVVADSVCDLRNPGGKLDAGRVHLDGYTRDFLVSNVVAFDTSLIGRKVTIYAIYGSDVNRAFGMPHLRASEVYTTLASRAELDVILNYTKMSLTSETKYYADYSEVTPAYLDKLPDGAGITIIDHEGDDKIDIVLFTLPKADGAQS